MLFMYMCVCVLVCCVGCEAPHGAVSGFDPPGASEQSDDDSESDEATAAAQAAARSGYAPTRALPPLVAKAFRKAFGAPTVPRYGEPMAVSLKHGLVRTRANQAAWRAIAINLAKMHEYFDLYYYNLVRFVLLLLRNNDLVVHFTFTFISFSYSHSL